MRKILLLTLLTGSVAAKAQMVSTFENLTLPGLDTAYVNFSQPGQDVGFSDGYAFFPSVYDTSGGFSYWSGGYAYSNERDTISGTFANQYAAKTGSGFGGSQKYVVYYEPFFGVRMLRLTNLAQGQAVRGFYITNTTYTYASIKNGDAFMGPRFGDSTATDSTHQRPDFLRVVARGYRAGVQRQDSAVFYLADFRAGNNANDYIVKDWTWFSLLPLGAVDSVNFRFESSRNNSFGNLVPAYFAMDNFTTDESGTDVRSIAGAADLKIFPNPATATLTIQAEQGRVTRADVVDMAGRTVMSVTEPVGTLQMRLDIATLAPGVYQLRIVGGKGIALHKFSKQ
jgi:hypothetical protein